MIEEYDMYTVKKAIQHETDRGGQVFYLHNRISSLDEILSILQKELPHLIFDVVHGTDGCASYRGCDAPVCP